MPRFSDKEMAVALIEDAAAKLAAASSTPLLEWEDDLWKVGTWGSAIGGLADAARQIAACLSAVSEGVDDD